MDPAAASSSTSASTAGVMSTSEIEKRRVVVLVHGILMGTAFAVLFPLGAAVVNVSRGTRYARAATRFHYVWQLLTLLVVCAGTGLGGWFLDLNGKDVLWKKLNGHPVIGVIVLAALIAQAKMGMVQHELRHQDGRPRSVPLNVIHRYWGRIALVLGAINGGLGLQLASQTAPRRTFTVVYSCVVGVSYLLWFCSATAKAIGRRERDTRPDQLELGAVSSIHPPAQEDREGVMREGSSATAVTTTSEDARKSSNAE